MFELSASVSMVLPELPLLDRIRLLNDKNLGVGLWDPTGLDLESIVSTGARISIMDGFGIGTIAIVDSAEAMLASAKAMIPSAKRLGSPLMNLHGAKLSSDGPAVEPIFHPTASMFEIAYETLSRFADLGEQNDVVFGLENLNPFDHPGVPFSSGAEVIELVRRVGNPHLRVNFDAYHAARGGENLTELLSAAVPLAAEIQLADAPTRHWPGEHRLDFLAIERQLSIAQYHGSVALEAWILTDAGPALDEFTTLFGKEQS